MITWLTDFVISTRCHDAGVVLRPRRGCVGEHGDAGALLGELLGEAVQFVVERIRLRQLRELRVRERRGRGAKAVALL